MDQTAPKTGPAVWLKWLVVLVLLLLLLGAALWLLPGGSSVQRRIDAIRKAGYPLTPLDLARAYPPLPDDQNSAIIYEKAFSELPSLPTNMDGWPRVKISVGDPFHFDRTELSPEIRRRIATFIGQNQGALRLLHQAAAIKNGRYAVDFGDGFLTATFTNVFSVLDACNCLDWAALLNADEKQPSVAAESILDSFGLSRSLENCPLVEAQMLRIKCLGLSCSTIELVLNKTTFSDEELARIYTAFSGAESIDGMKLALLCDRCVGIASYEKRNANLKRLRSQGMPLSARLRLLMYDVFSSPAAQYVSYLDLTSQCVSTSDVPYPRKLALREQIYLSAQKREDANRLWVILFDEETWHNRFMTDATIHAQLLLSECALGIERYRLANHDQLPATLQDLVPAYLPAVPVDPFDGKPLRYNRLPKGYLIYSVGKDCVDNGGAEWNEQTKTGDITFTVER
jgi:hypothetical protein